MGFLKTEAETKRLQFQYGDAGRADAGYKHRRDCVTRAIVFATGKPYKEVYLDLYTTCNANPGNGLSQTAYDRYMRRIGWQYINAVGKSFTTDDIPTDTTVMVRIKRHLCCVINGVIHDTYDPQVANIRTMRPRKILGYYIKPQTNIIFK